MNHSIIAFVVAGLVTLTTFAAEAKKPRVCGAWYAYTPAAGSAQAAPKNVYICVDNEEKPFAMFSPKVVEMKDKDGNTARLLVEVR